MKYFRYLFICLCFIFSQLTSSSCSDGRPAARADFTISVSLLAEKSQLDRAGNFVTETGEVLQLDHLSLHLSRISLYTAGAAGGQTVSFDAKNPPEPYYNCHAGHCHVRDSNQTKSVAEITAELGGSGGTVATEIVAVNPDKTFELTTFNAPLLLADLPGGDLPYGEIGKVEVTFDRVDLAVKKLGDGTELHFSNSHNHDGEVHQEAVSAAHTLDLTITRESEYEQDINLLVEIIGEFFGELPLDGASDAAHFHHHDGFSESHDDHDEEEEEGTFDFADLFGEHLLLEVGGSHGGHGHE